MQSLPPTPLCGIANSRPLLRALFASFASRSSRLRMLITVKLIDGMNQEYDIPEDNTILQLKEKLAEHTGLQVEQIALIFKGQALKDEHTIAGSKITHPGPAVTMIAQLRGGFY